MKSDLYTKFVLTVIALSLFVIAIQLTTKDAHAKSHGLYAPSGALMVTVCEPNLERNMLACADFDKGAITKHRVTPK